ncbi:carboxylating nicotinate-nucleotide diphosphorylase [Allorhizobium sp. BGMRC 0089]|uniref:carboxylating nicotinate-nucleotide diphosphorylase n=1 Tax=Allorhizobium sonneratiae TaxID=2934936 RepID=UPI0020339A50|nr:carboxylating nicotinate-nucleotide diphosphorylase [Allorhizobium sonneratiae]MCM2292773.1 carboxylating nicotinate-nucleotide diphosphorylase [Allorhizobium sonneratiae]
MSDFFLPRLMIEPLLRHALLEDLGLAGDITTDAVIPAGHRSTVVMASRESGVIAGLDLAELAFELIDPALVFTRHVADGDRIEAKTVLATVSGPSRALLTAERVALNFLCHLSGIATQTRRVVDVVAHTKAAVVCTRKTTPGLRAVEKYAVRMGGGMNHRFALYDAVLIKDNHIAIAGSVRDALLSAKARAGHMVKIEVEVDRLDQLQEVLDIGADAVLLDNMTPQMLRQAVTMIDGRAIAEASGGITLQRAAEIAETGVDLLSMGWITHSAPVLDIGLDYRQG